MALIPNLASKNNILLGTIQFRHPVDREVEYPISYKGKECVAKVEINGDTRKAHFELYEDEKISELYLLITEYLSKPDSHDIQHLITSKEHTYHLYKLTKKNCEENKEMLETWHITEITSQKKEIAIPDTTIILFMPPESIDTVQALTWTKDSNVIHLPIIKLKETVTKEYLYTIADKMKLAFLDFKFLHKKANLASIPFANNRLLSMPFTTRRSLAS
jgi:hypothetical protein